MRYGIALAALALSACSVGMTAKRHPHASTPSGATASASLLAGSACSGCPDLIVGELLAATDSGALILAHPRTVHFVHYSAMQRFQVEGIRNTGQPRTGPPRNDLRIASRYPAGVSPGLLRSLLSISTPDSVLVSR